MVDNWNSANLAGASIANGTQPHSLDFHEQQQQSTTLDPFNMSFNTSFNPSSNIDFGMQIAG
jgi:hypothetical protein